MTLNDIERRNKGFMELFGDFGLRHKSISFTSWRPELLLCDPNREFGIRIL